MGSHLCDYLVSSKFTTCSSTNTGQLLQFTVGLQQFIAHSLEFTTNSQQVLGCDPTQEGAVSWVQSWIEINFIFGENVYKLGP